MPDKYVDFMMPLIAYFLNDSEALTSVAPNADDNFSPTVNTVFCE